MSGSMVAPVSSEVNAFPLQCVPTAPLAAVLFPRFPPPFEQGNLRLHINPTIRPRLLGPQRENRRKPISEVTSDVGYEDIASFRTIFRRVTGLPPTEYRRRYAPLLATS